MQASASVHPIKIVPIGNSQGVRLPLALLRRYAMQGQIMMEERPDGLLLRSATPGKVSLSQTFAEMALEQNAGAEDWSDFDATLADGLATAKW